MKITILGATGLVGKVLLEKALERKYQINTLVRNTEKLGALKDDITFIEGDVFDIDKLEQAVSGSDIVLSTVPPKMNTKEPKKYAKLMENWISIFERNSIKRFIHIGGALHGGGENESWTIGRRMLKLFLSLFWRQGLVAKELEWEVLKKSNLDWTLVRPPRVSKIKSTGDLIANEKSLAGMQINVEDLAEFILDQIDSEKWLKKAPLVASEKGW